VHEHRAAGGNGHAWGEEEDLDAGDQQHSKEAEGGCLLGLAVPGGLVLILHVADDNRHQESRKRTANMTPDVDVRRDAGHHDHREEHEQNPENRSLTMRAHDVPGQQNLGKPHTDETKTRCRRSDSQFVGVDTHRDQIAHNTTDEIEEDELSNSELLLHAKSDS